MRVDVSISNAQIEQELATLQARMQQGPQALDNLPVMEMPFPDIEFRVRQIAREQRVYAIDTDSRLLVGYSVFDILPEASRRLHATVRSVHSRYAAPYQGRGIATALYTKVLSDGFVLISGARQSRAAYALWKSLGRRMRFNVVKVTPEAIEPLSISERDNRFHDLDVRLQLCAP